MPSPAVRMPSSLKTAEVGKLLERTREPRFCFEGRVVAVATTQLSSCSKNGSRQPIHE